MFNFVKTLVMIKTIQFHQTDIRFSDEGEGHALVFVHGYLLSLDVWQDFVKPLTRDYRVICIDMPGHGQSGLPQEISSMELMAGCIAEVIASLAIDKAIFFGHSMGGYTILALLENQPELFAGIALFHSHTMADSDEVRKKRDREIELIKKGHKDLLLSQSIPNMFATDNLVIQAKHVEDCKQRAKSMSDEAVIAAIRGLRARPNRSKVLAQASCPCLNIIGRKDNFIAFEEVSLKTVLPPGSEKIVSDQTGHMGFFEDPTFIRDGIIHFLKRIL
jgi:pimeloyl-ACP methyl ester carboxylesterase